MPEESSRRQPLRVPVYVLGNVHRQVGLGWRWSCNFNGCKDYGVRTDMESSWDAVVSHWHQKHKAAGGKQK